MGQSESEEDTHSIQDMRHLVALAILLCFSARTLIAEDIVCQLLPNCRKVPDDYETIQDCIDNAKDGDTCLIAPGNYHERIHIDETHASDLTIRGEVGKENPVLTRFSMV